MKLILKGGGVKRKKQINAIFREIYLERSERKGKWESSLYSVFLIHRTTT